QTEPRRARRRTRMRVSSSWAGAGIVAMSLVSLAALSGCTVTVKTQTKYTGTQKSASVSATSWTGQPIVVENGNGDVTVQPGSGDISVTMVPFAFADDNDKANADLAIQDAASTLALEVTADRIYVHCSVARQSYGSAKNGGTGCERLVVSVPAGS